MDQPSMTFKETRRLIRSDYQRLLKHYNLNPSLKNLINVILTPSMTAVFLFRLSHYFYMRRWRLLARLVFFFNLTLTGAELLPQTRVGEGLVLIHTVGCGFDAKIGNNVTIFGRTCIGSNPMDLSDVGAGPALPLIGDNVQLGLGCHVLGPVHIGNNAIIGPGAVVMKNVPEGAVVVALPPKILTKKEPG